MIWFLGGSKRGERHRARGDWGTGDEQTETREDWEGEGVLMSPPGEAGARESNDGDL